MLVKERIACERRKRGLSAQQLAELLHINRGTINRYENGTIKVIPIEMLKKLASTFDCSFDDFISEDPQYCMLADSPHTLKTTKDNDDALILKWYHNLPVKHQEFLKEVVINSQQS